MKMSVKVIAVLMSASVAMSGLSVIVSANTSSEVMLTSYYEDDTDVMTGGWSVNEGSLALSKNPDAKKALRKALKGFTGSNIEPIALLGTQVVSGTNYCFLCRTTVVYPDAEPQIMLVYVYEDLSGNAEITDFYTIISDEQLDGGFFSNTGKFSLKNNKKIYTAYKKAMNGFVGASYEPVAYLGSQVVSGYNHLILCRSKGSYPGASCEFSLVTVYADLEGNAKINDIETLELGKTDDDITSESEDDYMIGMPNPWQEYETIEDAANAAGVDFSAPDSLGNYKISYIQAMNGVAEITYKKGENEIYVRKGTGMDDISGDYNIYEKTVKVTVDDIKVTLRMNDGIVYSAIWTDGGCSYSYFARNGIAKKAALRHILAVMEENE